MKKIEVYIAQQAIADAGKSKCYVNATPAQNRSPALLIIAEEGEQLPEVPEWIKCENRLPEPNIEVLVAFEDDTVAGTSQWCRVKSPDIMGWLGPAENKNKVITHWQPLPKAPR